MKNDSVQLLAGFRLNELCRKEILSVDERGTSGGESGEHGGEKMCPNQESRACTANSN